MAKVSVSCLLLLCLVRVTPLLVDDHLYCGVRYRRLCQGKGRHVACQFPHPGPGDACHNFTEIKFTRELKNFVTNSLNRRRQRVAVGAERVRGGTHLPRPDLMMFVEWDRELAFLAQRLANQCYFVHDDCRATVRYPYAGQTVGEVRWRRLSESDELSAIRAIRKVIDAWWGERRRVEPAQLTAPFTVSSNVGVVWGHFSQLAVSTLRAVGCGAVRHGRDYTRMLLVCDFSHTNMLGQSTITPGPLAQCPANTARRPRSSFPLLCAPINSKPQEEDPVVEQYDEVEEQEDDYVATNVTNIKYNSAGGVAREFWHEEEKPTRQPEDLSIIRRPVLMHTTSEKTIIGHATYDTTHPPRKFDMSRSGQTGRPYVATRNKGRMSPIRTGWKSTTTPVQEYETVDYYKSTSRLSSQNPHGPRQRWKQLRDRPKRPGANALLLKPSPPRRTQPQKPIIASITLDQEDVDQLFRDTGFNIYWRQSTKQK